MLRKKTIEDKYNEVKKCFDEKQCVLKTTLEEFTEKYEKHVVVSHFTSFSESIWDRGLTCSKVYGL